MNQLVGLDLVPALYSTVTVGIEAEICSGVWLWTWCGSAIGLVQCLTLLWPSPVMLLKGPAVTLARVAPEVCVLAALKVWQAAHLPNFCGLALLLTRWS